MYLIIKGEVQFLLGNHKIAFRKMPQGSYFGETELIKDWPREFSVVAASKTKLLFMKKYAMLKIKEEYPEVYQNLCDISEKK
jgi:CRP-like cAMP-binding protein